MTVLFLLKNDPDATISKIIEENKKDNEVTVIDLRENKDYDRIVEQITSCDKVISW